MAPCARIPLLTNVRIDCSGIRNVGVAGRSVAQQFFCQAAIIKRRGVFRIGPERFRIFSNRAIEILFDDLKYYAAIIVSEIKACVETEYFLIIRKRAIKITRSVLIDNGPVEVSSKKTWIKLDCLGIVCECVIVVVFSV